MAYTTIDKPSDYFVTKLYTGNSGTQSITGLDFAPNFVWLKSRTQGGTGYNGMHYLFDTIRGATKRVRSNDNSAEATSSASLTAFNSDGFSVGSDDIVNYNSDAFVSWNWKANGSGSLNEVGSIDSTVSVNTTSGFSIVSYTGTGSAATVGHGLGSAPACYIIKQRDATGGWIVYHKGNTSSPETDYLRLDKTDATVDDAIFNDTAPTSSVFSIGTNAPVNTSSGTYIAYCFAEKQGYSKFGSYTGNGSTDGTFVYTGFKPAWFMCKKTDSVNSWVMFDNKRSSSGGSNEIDYSFTANEADAEETGTTSSDVDFCANGVKIREDNGGVNASGGSYIYMAFAENPFVTSTGVPGTAR